jgi:uncharacterized PurR-regulated membrane protein YhhQ (DUF165 family)
MSQESTSWSRAFLFGVSIAAAAAIVLIVVPNLLVTKPIHLDRGARVTLAIGSFVVSLGAVLRSLCKLQARGSL